MKRIIVEIKNKQTEVKEEGKVRVAAYCRVSTLKDEQKLSYESQCSYYEELIKSDGNMELVGVYGDQGSSLVSMQITVLSSSALSGTQ